MIVDWDDAYANTSHIPDGAGYPPRWAAEAAAFRVDWSTRRLAELDLAYGDADREQFDLFRPNGAAKGLLVFVHGGYWMAFDKSTWSHLAKGALARGWAVAIPSYTLAPAARLSDITRQIGRAITAAASRIEGPLRLAGHSAGGHLVTRMICEDSPLPPEAAARIAQVVSISGLHDLHPLLLTTRMNATLRLDAAEAASESAALRQPVADARVVCWVGENERPEFIRQNDLLADRWAGLCAQTRAVRAAGRHHFNVIEDLADPNAELARLCAP